MGDSPILSKMCSPHTTRLPTLCHRQPAPHGNSPTPPSPLKPFLLSYPLTLLTFVFFVINPPPLPLGDLGVSTNVLPEYIRVHNCTHS